MPSPTGQRSKRAEQRPPAVNRRKSPSSDPACVPFRHELPRVGVPALVSRHPGRRITSPADGLPNAARCLRQLPVGHGGLRPYETSRPLCRVPGEFGAGHQPGQPVRTDGPATGCPGAGGLPEADKEESAKQPGLRQPVPGFENLDRIGMLQRQADLI